MISTPVSVKGADVMVTEEIFLPAVKSKDIVPKSIRRWQILLAASFVLGTFLGLVGLLLSLMSAVRILTNDIITGQTEAALIVIALLLLIVGAHCVDRINELRTADREQTRPM